MCWNEGGGARTRWKQRRGVITKTGHQNEGGGRDEALYEGGGATTCWNEGGGHENVLQRRWGRENRGRGVIRC